MSQYFEVKVILRLHAESSAKAHEVVEQRLRGGMEPRNDPHMLMLREINVKRDADQR
jgi:hypothetical protein